jgi:hypothetical protein
MISCVSDEMALGPVREDDLPMLEKLTQDPEKTGGFGWADPRHWRRGWDENGLITPDGGTVGNARKRGHSAREGHLLERPPNMTHEIEAGTGRAAVTP